MENRIEFIKLEKPGENFTGVYKGISKKKDGNFLLVFGNFKDYNKVITISENMKYILRQANKAKDLILDCEIKLELVEIIKLKTEGYTYKKYKFTFGNGNIYEENDLNYLETKDINSYLE